MITRVKRAAMEHAASELAGDEPQRWWCRRCREPVSVIGAASLPPALRRGVHAATGSETGGPDGHLAAPIGSRPRELAAASAVAP
jgi:hypothetical protein